MLFAFQASYAYVFWNFGSIFDVAGGTLFFLGILIYVRATERSSVTFILVTSAVFYLAVKAKEMAVTLPAVWLAYDLICLEKHVDGNWHPVNLCRKYGLPLVIAGWFAYLKLSTMGSRDPSHAYFMDFSWLTIGRGFGWYFDRITGIPMRWVDDCVFSAGVLSHSGQEAFQPVLCILRIPDSASRHPVAHPSIFLLRVHSLPRCRGTGRQFGEKTRGVLLPKGGASFRRFVRNNTHFLCLSDLCFFRVSGLARDKITAGSY